MAFLEFMPDWIYTFLLLPIIILFQKHFSLKNDVTELKTNQATYIKKIDKICESNEELKKQVNIMIGRLDEHLRDK